MKRQMARGLFLLVLVNGCASTGGTKQAVDDLEHLKRSITKVQFAVQKTKVLIAKTRDADYLPELYMRLTELFAEEARYHDHVYAARGGRSVAAQIRRTEAVSTYRRLVELYPTTTTPTGPASSWPTSWATSASASPTCARPCPAARPVPGRTSPAARRPPWRRTRPRRSPGTVRS